MGLLSRNILSSVDDFQYATVPCPEWDCEARVRGLSAADQAYITRLVNEKKTEEIAVNVVIRGCVDENGERVFDNSDRDLLKSRSYAVIDRLAKKILELSGSGDADSIEKARKN